MTNNHFKKSPSVSVVRPVGTMKGTITHKNGSVFVFDTRNIIRMIKNGDLLVSGWIVYGDSQYQVELQLDNENPPSGRYIVGTEAVTSLFIYFPPAVGYMFKATSGSITLENHAPGEVRLNGRMEFETEDRYGDQFDVDLIFEVTGEV